MRNYELMKNSKYFLNIFRKSFAFFVKIDIIQYMLYDKKL